MSVIEQEIASQPGCWRRAASLTQRVAELLPHGERVAIVGCGTSYNVALALAVLRERSGHGETDAFAASEMPAGRAYDRILAISRSGTTTEVVRLLEQLGSRVSTAAISAVAGSPVTALAARALVLGFADERAVVQTRFATTTVALLRAYLGDDVVNLSSQAEQALDGPIPASPGGFEHFVFLGRGWSVGIAHEAALKVRESAAAWAESYPAMEYRHGPISVPGPRSLVWALDSVDDSLEQEIAATGATFIAGELDPMVELVLVQRMAVRLALSRGLDPDRPRRLARSVVLT